MKLRKAIARCSQFPIIFMLASCTTYSGRGSNLPSGPASSTEHSESVYSGPLFDAHAHIIRSAETGATAGDIASQNPVTLFRQNGLSGQFLFGPPTATTQQQKGNTAFVYPFAGAPIDPQKRQLKFDENTVSFVEQQLKLRIMKGIGEIPMRHRPTFDGAYKGYPADGPIALGIYDLAAKYKVPVNVHVEHEYSGELERALAHNENVVIIWAHAGDGPASLVRDMMRRNKNLYADISTRNPFMKLVNPIEEQSLTDPNNRIKDDWKAVFEEFPDRFLFGLDINTPERLRILEQLVAYYRSVLGQLTHATAEKIAYRNAGRLLGT